MSTQIEIILKPICIKDIDTEPPIKNTFPNLSITCFFNCNMEQKHFNNNNRNNEFVINHCSFTKTSC